jgi:hypothetical protein
VLYFSYWDQIYPDWQVPNCSFIPYALLVVLISGLLFSVSLSQNDYIKPLPLVHRNSFKVCFVWF